MMLASTYLLVVSNSVAMLHPNPGPRVQHSRRETLLRTLQKASAPLLFQILAARGSRDLIDPHCLSTLGLGCAGSLYRCHHSLLVISLVTPPSSH